MRRHVWIPALTVVVAAVLAAAAAVVTNYATVEVPEFFRDRWRSLLTLLVLVLVAVVIELMALWPRREPHPVELGPVTAAPSSLRRPAVGVAALRGREAELRCVLDQVSSSGERLVVVCGAGGMGKTTLAEVVAERAEQLGRSVFWLRWRDAEAFAAQMVEVACALGLSPMTVEATLKSGASMPDLVWRHMFEVRRWVLVLDNVDSPEALSPGEPVADYRGWVRPAKTGLVLVTSRDRSTDTWGSAVELVDLSPLSPRAGAQLLLDLVSNAGSALDAELLATRLGGLPLALHAAGAALASPTARLRSFSAYNEALRDKSAEVLPSHPDVTVRDVARKLVGYTWELSLEQMAVDGHPLAKSLLRALSLLAEAPIPLSLITPILIPETVGSPDGAIAQPQIDTALAGLHRYGLVDAPDATRTISLPTVALHPLVRETNALLLQRDLAQNFTTWQRAANNALINLTTTCIEQGRPAWPLLRLLIPHLVNVPDLDQPEDIDTFRTIRDALDDVADQLGAGQDLPLVFALRQRVLLTEISYLGEDHPDTLSSQNNLGNAVSDLGRHREAADLFRATLDTQRQVLGEDHPDTLSSQNNLGNALNTLGKHREAADLYRATLQVRREVLGEDHPDTLGSQNNLGSALRALGRHREAADLFRATLDTQRQVLGEDHPDTLVTQNNLAAEQHPVRDRKKWWLRHLSWPRRPR